MRNEEFKFVTEEIKKFGPIHWAFLLLVVLPLAVVAAPFYLVGVVGISIGRAIGALIGFLSLKLPNYK